MTGESARKQRLKLASELHPSLGPTVRVDGTHFRVWANNATRVDVISEADGRVSPLNGDSQGYFEGVVGGMTAGHRYKYRIDGGEAFPDPASRFQPEGPHGPSEIVDPTAYQWGKEETEWPGYRIDGQVLYELHIGTFTPLGTFLSAIAEFARLRQLGITVLELMPLAEFSGDVGWGYDGVDLYAPFHHYGSPDNLREMVDAAHRHGMALILDVVYNHLGPDGNYLPFFSKDYLQKRDTEWGAAINFDGENSLAVREFFLANAEMWISEYHFDGLRLDATQAICDNGRHGTHIIQEICQRVREAGGGRETVVLAENEPEDCSLITPVDEGGYGLDAVWNDDFHHSAIVALTGRREAYYSDHLGRPQEFISAAKYGYLFQGQYYAWQEDARGTSSLNYPHHAYITFLENHDQVANYGRSLRVHLLTSPSRYRAITALWLLGPGTPMFFQGQEYGSTRPFYYFAGHEGELGEAISKGRAEFMLQFGSQDTDEMKQCFVEPSDPRTFEWSKLDPEEQTKYPQIVRLHKDLLALRKHDPVLSRTGRGLVDGAVLEANSFVLRFLTHDAQDRLLIVNLGAGVDLPHAPEPLLAPPRGCQWNVVFSSEKCAYGGNGASAPYRFGALQLQAECTQLLVPERTAHRQEPDPQKTGNPDHKPS